MTLKPTAEQAEAIRLALLGDDLRIEAGAGTGKTTTLVSIAEAMPDQPGTFVAFNKAIVVEAGEQLPPSVTSKTMHALAFRTEGVRLKHKLNRPRMKSARIARLAGVDELVVNTSSGRRTFAAGWCASQAMLALRRFCQSDRPVPTAFDVPIPRAAKFDEQLAEVMDQIRDHIAQYLPDMWEDMLDVDGVLPTGHEVYLKSAVERGLVAGTDYLMLDEAQDLSRVMIKFALQSKAQGTQLIAVGDESQAINGWTGATSIAPYLPDANVCYLSESFRFGPAVADVANSILQHLPTKLRLTGRGPDSEVRPIDDPTCVLSRTNATAVRNALLAMAQKKSFHIMGGAGDVVSFCEGAIDLQAGRSSQHPDLVPFGSWAEVERYAKEDPLGGDLALLVNLINDFKAETIVDALKNQVPVDRADVVFSTAHKVKGLAFREVALARDFPAAPDPDDPEETMPSKEALMLLYVAVTRAKLALDITDVGFLNPPGAKKPGVASATAEVIEAPVPELAPAPKALPAVDLDEMARRTDREGFYARIERDKRNKAAAAAAADDQ